MLIVTILGTALFARLSLAEVNHELHVLTEDRMVKVEQLESVRDNINVIARAVRNVVLLADASAAAPEVKRIESATAANMQLIQKLTETIQSDKGKALLKVVQDARSPYNDSVQQVAKLVWPTTPPTPPRCCWARHARRNRSTWLRCRD